MAVWLVRAGSYGEREEFVLSSGVAAIGWEDLPDLSTIHDRGDLAHLCRATYPDDKPRAVANWVGQLWAFLREMNERDLVVLPLKKTAVIAIGEVQGPYQYRSDFPSDARHARPVKWLRTDIPRTSFDQDLLYSFGAYLTVCQIWRNNAEERIRAMLSGKVIPLPKGMEPESEEKIDLEQVAQDEILKHIAQRFRGHDLARLVESILIAEGYHTQRSPVGPDGGVDIIAGKGPMGFDEPKLCVQVKSSETPADVAVLRELHGVIKGFNATQGLLVSWSGFKSSVDPEARRLFFEIRLWDSRDLVKALLSNYEKLPETLQAELPIKRIWALALEE